VCDPSYRQVKNLLFLLAGRVKLDDPNVSLRDLSALYLVAVTKKKGFKADIKAWRKYSLLPTNYM
jgi:hypothetical protein